VYCKLIIGGKKRDRKMLHNQNKFQMQPQQQQQQQQQQQRDPSNHVIQRWLPTAVKDQVKKEYPQFMVSSLEDNIIAVSGTRSIVHQYKLTAVNNNCKKYYLQNNGFLEAHNTSPFQTVCQTTKAIYSGCYSGDVAVYGLASRAWSKCLAHSKPITCMSPPLNNDATPLLTGTSHGSCAAHDSHTMLEVGRSSVHTEKVTWIHAWERSSFLSASKDGTAALWDVRAPPKKRIIKRFTHGTDIITGNLLSDQILCTVSLPLEKVQCMRSRKGYVRRRSVFLNFWDIRQGTVVDTAKMVWDGVDITNVMISPSIECKMEGTRSHFTLLSAGKRTIHNNENINKSETVVQGCNERGQRKFSIKPIHRNIIGGTFCDRGFILASTCLNNDESKKNSNFSPELCFVSTNNYVQRSNIEGSNDSEKKSSKKRLSLISWNKKLANMGAQGNCLQMLDLLNDMISNCIYPNSVSFEVTLRAMVKHKKLIPVATVLDHMEVMRIRPLDQTCIALLRLASAKRTNPFAKHLMKRLSKLGNPTVREVFIELLLINSTKSSLKLAFDMLMDTARRKLGISRALIQMFLKAAHARRATNLAYELLTAIKEKSQINNGLQAQEFEAVACMLATIRETEKALVLLSQALDTFGLKNSFNMACSLIKSFGRAGLFDVTLVIHSMLRQYEYYDEGGLPPLPTATTKKSSKPEISTLSPPKHYHKEWKLGPRVLFAAANIDAALSCAQPHVAMHILKNLNVGKTKSHHKSFVFLANALIRFVSVLEADVLPDEQTKVIGYMQNMGMKIPYECLVSLLGCLALRKRITESMYLFNTLRHFKHEKTKNTPATNDHDDRKTNHALAVLISAVGRAGMPRVLNKLLTDVFHPKKGNHVIHVDLQIVESTVEALRCIEQPRRAIEIWIKGGEKLTRLVCNNVLICYGMTCQIRKMAELITCMKLGGCRPDSDSYAAVLVGCISAGRLDKAVNWLMEFCKYQERRTHQAVDNIALWFRELKENRRKRKEHEIEQEWDRKRVSTDDDNEGDGEGEVEDEEKIPAVKSTQMFSAIRQLLAKQQRLRKSSRSHPDMAEAMSDLIDRLVRTEQHDVAIKCLKRIFWVYGTTDIKSALFVLEAGCATSKKTYSMKMEQHEMKTQKQKMKLQEKEENKKHKEQKMKKLSTFQKWQLEQQNQQEKVFGRWEQKLEEKNSSNISCKKKLNIGLDIEWLLRTIEPRHLPLIRSDLFGQAIERVAVARESSLAGYVVGELIEMFASNGGALSSSIVEAMLRASECEREARRNGKLEKSHLEQPLVIWQKAAEYGVPLSDRARLLLLRSLVAVDAISEAMHFLKSFHGKGHRITPLVWMLKVVCKCDRLDDVLFLYNIELSRNHTIPKEVELYVQNRKPKKEHVFRHRKSLEDLLALKLPKLEKE
jgi:hypothetical protein